jgi:hypothetical protein
MQKTSNPKTVPPTTFFKNPLLKPRNYHKQGLSIFAKPKSCQTQEKIPNYLNHLAYCGPDSSGKRWYFLRLFFVGKVGRRNRATLRRTKMRKNAAA